jgi:hypothetical protein
VPAPPPAPEAPPANLTIRIPEPLPDSVAAGTPFAVPYLVQNVGGRAASPVKVTLLLVTPRGDRVLDQEDVQGGLAPRGRKQGRLRAELPAATAGTRARLKVVVDRENQVEESNEADDVAETEVVVEAIQAGSRPTSP